MLKSLAHLPAQLRDRLPTRESGLEIIEGKLASRGILPVREITITDSGLVIYRIRNSSTNGSLEQAVKSSSVGRVEAVRVTLDALRVVSEMHADRELEAHGDITPKNVFVDRTHQTASISGFYNSVIDERALTIPSLRSILAGHHHTAAGHPHVEPAFTAPEVVLGGQPDSSSDVYEAARTLLYGLHGQELGPTVQYEDFMDRFEPVPPPELSGDFPPIAPNGMRFVIQAGLDPNPANRPEMSELVTGINEQLPALEAAA